MIILDFSAGTLSLGLVLALVYEVIALVVDNGKVPTITSLVRPWLASHKLAGSIIAALWVGASAWFFIHFYL